jgi:hypothetical protein
MSGNHNSPSYIKKGIYEFVITNCQLKFPENSVFPYLVGCLLEGWTQYPANILPRTKLLMSKNVTRSPLTRMEKVIYLFMYMENNWLNLRHHNNTNIRKAREEILEILTLIRRKKKKSNP